MACAVFPQKPTPLNIKSLVSRLQPTAGPEPRAPQLVGEASGPTLSAQALKEMALNTKSIAFIAASRRCKVQDKEGNSLDSRDSSPADRRWPHASSIRDHSMDRKMGRKRSPSFTWSMQPVSECGPGCWGVVRMAREEAREDSWGSLLQMCRRCTHNEGGRKACPRHTSPSQGLRLLHDPKPSQNLSFVQL